MKSAAEKLDQLKKILESYSGAVIAFSGGVDSTFLAWVAHGVLAERAMAVTASSEIYAQDEIKMRATWQSRLGFPT